MQTEDKGPITYSINQSMVKQMKQRNKKILMLCKFK